ncbi:MAG TPA: MFS transporter [Ktedonobacterales bacterium]|nr:MFS transporter [Ktedonobacterales bacterium]
MQTVAAPARSVRWRIPVVFGVTFFVNYLDRNNLALALPIIANEFGWSDKQTGEYGQYLLGAFFLALGLSNIFLSPLAQRIGPRRSVILAIASFSVVTILQAPLGQYLIILIMLRLLLGVGEGFHVPMMSEITSRWFPRNERSRANAIWNVGILLATALGPLILVPLITSIGWRPAFAVLGVAGMLISIPLVLLVVRNEPRREDGVSEAELAYIRHGSGAEVSKETASPSASYLRSPSFWLMALAGTLNAFCGFGVLNWLPTYFARTKGIDFSNLGWPLAIIFSAGVVGVLFMAALGDRVNRRVLLMSGGYIVAAGMLYFATTMMSLIPLVALFALGVFFQSAYTGQEFAVVQRIVPDTSVGSGSGVYNGLSILIGGVGGSIVPGTIVAITGSFTAGMLSIVCGAVLAAIALFVLARVVRY